MTPSNRVSRAIESAFRMRSGLNGNTAPPQWRLRVGDWRVRFRFNYATRTIEVLHVLSRGPAYRD